MFLLLVVLAVVGVNLGSGLDPAQCSKDHIRSSLGLIAGCEPRDVVVQLPWPNHTDIQQMTPTHVLVKQCTGGCTPLEPSCLPSTVHKLRVPVLVAKCGISLGMCDKECASIEIEEHTECKCACALSPRDCTERQQFVSSECACKCTNTNERRECYESGKVWNPSSCACTCPAHKCSLGAHLDELTCMCAAIVDFNERSLLNLTNVELMSLEVLIIIFLVSTVTVLFLLFLCLVWKLRRMRRIEGRKRLVPSTLSGVYLSSTDPCTDLKEGLRRRDEIRELREPGTDSSHCSSSSCHQSSSNQSSCSEQSIEILPVNHSLAIKTGTLRRKVPGDLGHQEYVSSGVQYTINKQ